MLLLDFIVTQFFERRPGNVKREDIIKLTNAINGVVETFKKVADDLDRHKLTHVVRVPHKADDTFN